MSPGKWQPFCLGLNVLKAPGYETRCIGGIREGHASVWFAMTKGGLLDLEKVPFIYIWIHVYPFWQLYNVVQSRICQVILQNVPRATDITPYFRPYQCHETSQLKEN